MKLDSNYTLTGEKYNWVLSYKSDVKTNEEGKEYHSTDTWYFPNIEVAIKKYLDENLKACKTMKELLIKFDYFSEIVKALNVK